MLNTDGLRYMEGVFHVTEDDIGKVILVENGGVRFLQRGANGVLELGDGITLILGNNGDYVFRKNNSEIFRVGKKVGKIIAEVLSGGAGID